MKTWIDFDRLSSRELIHLEAYLTAAEIHLEAEGAYYEELASASCDVRGEVGFRHAADYRIEY